MKTIVMTTLPTCDICRGTAKYDAPTIHRMWANMCQICFDNNASDAANTMGYEFTTEATPETDRQEKIALAVEDGDMELVAELVGDGDFLDYI